ncbi:hypothetical protein PENTCL1PPCAC_24273, partial [Pristionchus entomophagus]
STPKNKAPLPPEARGFPRYASQESVDNLTTKMEAIEVMLAKILSIVDSPSPSLPSPITPSLAPMIDLVSRQVYEAYTKAASDVSEYASKEKRAVIIGSVEKMDPSERVASDQKMVETLIDYCGDPVVKKALDEGLITHHRHPKERPPGSRPLKIEFPNKSIRDALLSGIRSKPGRTPLPSRSFVRRDLTPHQLELERSARDEVIDKNPVAGKLAFGVRDYSIISYRTPSDLLPNYGQFRKNRYAPPKNNSADRIHSALSTASTPASSSSAPLTPPTLPETRTNYVNNAPRGGGAAKPRISRQHYYASQSTVPVYYANARSIRCKQTQLSFLLSAFAYRLISLTETWLADSDCDAYLIGGFPDYLVFRCDRKVTDDSGRGGGVACIVHNSLDPVLVSTFVSSLLEAACILDLHLTYSTSLPFHKIKVITVYRSPSSPSSSFSSFLSFIAPLITHDFPCLLIGDFNYPHIDWSSMSSPSHEDFIDFVSDYQLHQFVTFPTRLSNCLDLVFCNYDVIRNIFVFLPLPNVA